MNGRFFAKTLNESAAIALLRATAGAKHLVRVSGGCGFMSPTEEKRMMSFAKAFEQFTGTIIGGGTRMVYKSDYQSIRPGVTEILPAAKRLSPKAITLGLIPRVEDQTMVILSDGRIAFLEADEEQEEKNDYVTVIMPGIDVSLLLQKTADKGVTWEDEIRTAIEIELMLRQERNYLGLGWFYNGGGISEKEMLSRAKLGWHTVLVRDSGRMCDKYCNDKLFLKEHKHIHAVENPEELQNLMTELLPV